MIFQHRESEKNNLICFWCEKPIEYTGEDLKPHRKYAHWKCSTEIYNLGKEIENSNSRLVEIRGKTYLLGAETFIVGEIKND